LLTVHAGGGKRTIVVVQSVKTVGNNVGNDVQLEVSLREKLNKFTNAVNSCDFSGKGEYLVAAGR